VSLGSCERDDFATFAENRKKKENKFASFLLSFVYQGKNRAFC